MRNFKRVREDFVCEMCGTEVLGDGYTDHCPECLWGKHVDEKVPGDRMAKCGGLMEPAGARLVGGRYRIEYRCFKCRHQFVVREGRYDKRERLVELLIEKNVLK